MNMQNKHSAPSVQCRKSCAVRLNTHAKIRRLQSNHESADSYVGVITQLDVRHRLILCKDAMQWIIQEKRGQGRRQGNWRGKSYITCPKSVFRACDVLCGPLSDKTIDVLRLLPSKPGGKS